MATNDLPLFGSVVVIYKLLDNWFSCSSHCMTIGIYFGKRFIENGRVVLWFTEKSFRHTERVVVLCCVKGSS